MTWNLSTAFHPQTDGLTERKNQWIEQYLRLVTANQEEWSNMLPLATLIHNNARNSTTGYAPNELLIGREPPAIPTQITHADNPLAEQRISQLRERRLLAMQALNTAAKAQTPSESRWKMGQKVWLDSKNLALPYGTIKLAPRRHGPFEITKVV